MSNATIRLAEPVVFLVGGLDYERARQRQRRATARAAHQAHAGEAGIASPSPGPSRHPSPERGTSGTRAASISRPGSRAPSVPGSRAASPGPRGRLANLAEDFIAPTSRGRSQSRHRTLVETPEPAPSAAPDAGTASPAEGSGNRGRSGSLVREMTEAQIRLQLQQEQAALDEPPPAMLRGILSVHLSKPTRVTEIGVRFKGTARTDWPEGEDLPLQNSRY